MSSQDEGRRAVVFHEAGHCWGYWAVGRRFRYATLRPRTDSFNGATLGYRDWEWDELHALAIVAASGPVAELLHRIERDPRHPELEKHLLATLEGGHSDLPRSGGILKDEARVQRLGDFMDRHWSGVTQVATSLLDRGRVTGKRAFEIFDATAPEDFEDPFHVVWYGR